MRVLVCGGRDYKDWDAFWHKLWRIMDETIGPGIPFEIISGGARGADRMAKKFAEKHDLKFHEFPADWKKHGKAAGYIRNKLMVEDGRPDLIVAFPGGKGTASMVKLGQDAGIETKIITD